MAEDQFGPYRLVRQLAVGGMAEVYLAKAKGIAGFEKYVALKMIRADFAEDEHFIQMLVDEAKLAVQLSHANIAQTFDLGRVGDTVYITMEYVDGFDLYKTLQAAAERELELPFDVCAYVVRAIASALDHAHGKRDATGKPLDIVHRDVSPQNVLISFSGDVKLVDFGVAKTTMQAHQTGAGMIKGKYNYMSPEQAAGDPIDHRSDIFSAGIILYEMITGQLLYYEEDPRKVVELARRAAIPPPSHLRTHIPPELERIVMTAVEKDRRLRYQTAGDLARDLERFLHAQSPDFTPATLVELVKSALGLPTAPVDEMDDGPTTKRLPPDSVFLDKKELRDENSMLFRHSDLEAAAPPSSPSPARKQTLPPGGRITVQVSVDDDERSSPPAKRSAPVSRAVTPIRGVGVATRPRATPSSTPRATTRNDAERRSTKVHAEPERQRRSALAVDPRTVGAAPMLARASTGEIVAEETPEAADVPDELTLSRKRTPTANRDTDERPSRPRVTNTPDFGPRYRVIGVIGRGGMGEVYRAFDNDLGEEVALKAVRADDVDTGGVVRFRREIALARKVSDPHVLRVYDLDEHEGLRFLSMEFVDGESLASLLRKGPLPRDRALAIFRQVCLGLGAAHDKGVIHRDLKPQNVLLDSTGNVRVADFGLARTMGESGMTASGAILGSPAYMSPEQVKGDPVDERTDIYSLGILLYQLVAGEPPFKADTPHALMEMRLHKKPRPLREHVPDAPAYLEAIVERCLRVDPEDRYRSIRELLADLDRRAASPARTRRPWLVAAGALATAAVAGTVAIFAWPTTHEESPPPARAPLATAAAPPAIAESTEPIATLILGVENRTGDAVLDDVLDMVLESALRRSRRLDPISGVNLQQLATELGAATAIDRLASVLASRDQRRVLAVRGTVTTKGQGFAVSLEAVDHAGAPAMKETVEARSTDEIIGAMGRLAAELRKTVGETVATSELEQTGLSRSLEAVQAYARGLANKRSGNDQVALEEMLRAVKLDPSFAKAQATLGLIYYNLNRQVDADRHLNLALGALDRMADRDRLKFIGDYHITANKQPARAIAAYRELLATWPNDMPAAASLAISLVGQHEIQKALEVGRQSARRHPRAPYTRANLPAYELMAGNFETTLAEVKRVIADFPVPYRSVYLYSAIAQMFLDPKAAEADYARHQTLDPSLGLAANADRALAEGRLADAARLLAEGIAHDVKAANAPGDSESKQLMLAELALRRRDMSGARAAAAKVTYHAHNRMLAAIVQLAAGDERRALATAKELAGEIAPNPRAYAKLIEAERERRRGNARDAVLLATEAVAIADAWFARYLLALAYLDAGELANAFTELKVCHARRGEIALTIDSHPGVRYAFTLSYYLGRTQEALGSPEATASYQAFLAVQPNADPNDPLVADARARLERQ